MNRKKVMAFLKKCTCTYFKVRRGTNGLMSSHGTRCGPLGNFNELSWYKVAPMGNFNELSWYKVAPMGNFNELSWYKVGPWKL